MKKVAIVLLSLLCVAGLAFAADGLSPYFDKGSMAADVGIGWGGLSGGVEYDFVSFNIAKAVPLTIGAAARVTLDPGLLDTDSSFTLGAGALATAHVELSGLEVPDWLKKIDFGFGLGLGFATATPAGDYSDYTASPGIGIATFESLSYFFNKNLAVSFEYGYLGDVNYKWTYWDLSYPYPVYYSTIGITYKF
jgi:hypothetical protein